MITKDYNLLSQDLQKGNFSGLLIVTIENLAHFEEAIKEEILLQTNLFLQEFGIQYKYALYRIHTNEFALRSLTHYISHTKFEEDMQTLFENIKNVKLSYPKDIQITIRAGISLERDKALKKASFALTYAQKKEIPYIAYSKFIDRTLEVEKEEV